jgi:catechol 2,3-dioxygenase-like lactoylglutathione lyase family enzyme
MRAGAALAPALIAATLASPAVAGVATVVRAGDHGVAPWTEAVISVERVAPFARLLGGAGGWRRVSEGAMARAELDYWQLPAQATGRFERWCAPAVSTGCLRFVIFKGVAQEPIRLAARAWDSGGIYSIMMRSDDVPGLFSRAIKAGWWAESPPIRFNFGGSDLRNVVLTGPHGINFGVYERLSPPFTAFPLGRLSQGFNAMRMVAGRQAARDFYNLKLGFGIVFDGDGTNAIGTVPEPSNFGIPLNYTLKALRAAAALNPVPGETGRVEVMQITEFSGIAQGARARAPNLGILSVRYPVRDLAGYRAALAANGVTPVQQGSAVPIGGLGAPDLFAVVDPDGSLTEFYDAR